MRGNLTWLEKADLALSDLALGGLLQPAQATKFLQVAINESVVMKEADVIQMRSPKQLMEKSRFGSRVLRETPGENTPLSLANRSKPDLSKVELDAKEFLAEVRINLSVLEDNIERKAFRQTIMSQLAQRIALDMDEWIVNADTGSSDTFLAVGDGMIKRATSNIVNHASNSTNQQVFASLFKAMPSEFLRDKRRLRFYTSIDSEIDYRRTLSERQTNAGDTNTMQNVAQTPFGTPLVAVPVFPENLGGGTDETVIIATDPKNIGVGVWRQLAVDTDKDVSAREVIIVMSVRFDMVYAVEEAVAKAINVKVA